jgi:predicted acyltransferase
MAATDSTSDRLASLDAFRGFTIAGMVLVNNPGSWSHLYPQLAHAEWNGWTFTDWIFPFFLYIVGMSMVISLGKHANAGARSSTLLLKTAKRALIIIAIGLLLNLIPSFNFETVRIPGVLQRIGLCVLLAAPMVIWLGWRGQAIGAVLLCSLYAIIQLNVPVMDPNGVIAVGSLEAGRDVGAYLDRLVLDGHLWARAKTWDPEGLLSTLPAIATLLTGALTAHWLRTPAHDGATRTVWMLLAGLACLWVGAMLDSVLMPINKSLWTPSYVVFMAGWSLIVFGAFYWLMDAIHAANIRNAAARWFKPFTVYGMNALFIFALSGLIAKMLGFIKFDGAEGKAVALKTLLYSPIQSLPLSPVNQSLLFAILFNLFMLGIAWFMWKKKWFIKV